MEMAGVVWSENKIREKRGKVNIVKTHIIQCHLDVTCTHAWDSAWYI